MLDQISGVGLSNLTQVVSHQMTEVLGTRSHVVHFVNGGVLQFAYNLQGQLLELTARNLEMKILAHGQVTFGVKSSWEMGIDVPSPFG
jgi:hypothetical protein